MLAFKTILVPTDFSPDAASALDSAVSLASQLGAELRLVHVVPTSALRAAVREGLLTEGDTDDTVRAKVDARVNERFDALLARFGDRCVGAGRVVLHGDPVREVVDYVRASNADLVVVGRRGSTFAEVLLGSVAERLVRHAPCPVLVAPDART